MRIIALVKRILLQMVHDKRTLALMMIAPLIILTLMNLLFNTTSASNIKIGAYNINTNIIDNLKESDIDIYEFSDNNDISNKIKENKLNAFISINNDKLYITYENSDPTKTKQIGAIIQSSITKIQLKNLLDITKKQQEIINFQSQFINQNINNNMIPNESLSTIPNEIERDYIYGNEDTNIFDSITPILIGFFVFFFVFLISGISLLKERTSGTLNKLLATPIKRSHLVFGYLIGYGIFAVIQTFIVVLFSIYVLKIEIVGSISLLLLTNIMLAFVALSLGIFLSTFANSEFQMIQFIPIIVLPQILFSGIIPLESMANWIQGIAKLMPLYYASDALKKVIIMGNNFGQIQFDLFILLIFSVIFTTLNILGLKRYRYV